MKLHTRIGVGLLLGAASGIVVNSLLPGDPWVGAVVRNVAIPVGQVFLRLLLMTVVPLVFASLTLAPSGFGDIGRLGRVGGRTLGLFVLSTGLSAALGLLLVGLLAPGSGISSEVRRELLRSQAERPLGGRPLEGAGVGVDTFVGIVPTNPLEAAASGDMLGVIFFSLALGGALTLVSRERRVPFLAVVAGLNEAILQIIGLAMRLAPYGVFALVFAVTARFGWHLLVELAAYASVVILGLLIHGAVSLSVLVWALARLSPAAFWWSIRASMITAFSTSSSNATLPTSIAVAERELGVPSEVAGFVLPLGATLNMNGTALYEGVTVLFLAQLFGVELTLGQQALVLVLAVLTAVGAAGVPGGSLPLLMVVLAAVGVPPEGVGIILGIDRILDMCRTSLNVGGDLAVAVIVARAEAAATAMPGVSASAPIPAAAASPTRTRA